ncbi:hypothetical protein [uncultured Meiothermus sp.]|jgi:hypothetical protein|uniref:hypothetical protein n=1 Tax=uncultured Meiothermus sp. TaxID=157471 RepID=UPI0026133E03|nr:hypothetical protein [uncultured Meiothermus sp.]
MDQKIAESIASIAEIGAWIYMFVGWVIYWGYRFLIKEDRRLFPIMDRLTWGGVGLLFLVWLLDGIAASLGKYLATNMLPETAGVQVVSKPVEWGVLFWAAKEEIERIGIFQLFSNVYWVGVWLNSLWFGFIHLSGQAVDIAIWPEITILKPLSTAAFGLACLAIILRMGLVWAILLHFAANTVRLVVVTESVLVNYLLFFGCVALLVAVGLLSLRQYSVGRSCKELTLAHKTLW